VIVLETDNCVNCGDAVYFILFYGGIRWAVHAFSEPI
jgi:hypothetical protein